MKWSFTSPDGIGDFLLRLPWLIAMESHGWKLQLLGREPTLELARLAGLKADMVLLRLNPYSKEPRKYRNPFARELKAIRKFQPDLLFFGPSQPSFLEEEIVRLLPDLQLAGFVVEANFWPSEGNEDPRDLVKKYSIRIPISPTMSEPARNEEAASKLLRKKIVLTPFQFPRRTFQSPKKLFHSLGIVPKDYFIVSPGYRAGDYFQGWGEENWGRELKMLEEITDASFLFTGSTSEEASNRLIFSKLQHQERHYNLTGKLHSLKLVGELLAHANGYIGKDSGTMHFAAALRKPVLVVMGGGTWGRFSPVGTKSVIITVALPCRGCHWRCPFEEPYCVRLLQEGSLLRGWEELQKISSSTSLLLEQPLDDSETTMITSIDYENFRSQIYHERRKNLQHERKLLFQPWYKKLSLEKLRNLFSNHLYDHQ